MNKSRRINVLLLATFVLFLSFSTVFAEKKDPVRVKALVIPSRNYASMQPQIYHAFLDTAKKIKPLLKIKFVLFNPFLLELSEEGPKFKNKLSKFMNLLNECVHEVVAIKKAKPETDNLLNDIHDYIKNNPESYLAKLHKEAEILMEDFEFLVIESSDTYGIHPMFYVPFVTQIDTPDGATKGDIIEALYGFFFLDAAFKQNKPVWGTCHGAQMGYVHAGGKLARLYEYIENSYDLDFKKNGQKTDEVEIWHIGRWLYTHKKDTDYREYGVIACPVPEIFKDEENKGEEIYINKDFEHSLAMVTPVPDNVEVISYHPLSEYKDRGIGKKYEEFNKEFEKILKNQAFIDTYKYKTMLGTQYHPQYSYNDLETSIIFEYLVRQLANRTESLSPAVNDFKLLIEGDPELYMLFNEMFEQANKASLAPGYPSSAKQIKDYHQMLLFLDSSLNKAPKFDDTGYDICFINDALIGVMGTPAGAIAFLDPRVNEQLKNILREWAVFLSSPDSRYVLNEDPATGWFGANASKAMPNFMKDFQCDPKAPYYGFTSWDDFFTRELRKGVRPVADPKDDRVIVNACESAPYRLAADVKLNDRFWIKEQPYSLVYMFDGDPSVREFVGGTIYQAYLSALCYHRWHAPLSGKIIKIKIIDGSYFATNPGIGFDPIAPVGSQGYLAAVATRALILIEADNPDIGLMALLFIGMGDVSSNEVTVSEGQHVTKGDPLGTFHFGGSSYCMIFQPGVFLEFDLHGQTPGLDSNIIPVRSKIATAVKK